jgi:hypothetical protein
MYGKGVVNIKYFIVDGLSIGRNEGTLADQKGVAGDERSMQFLHYDPEGPDIDLVRVSNLFENFWGHVKGSTAG